VFERRSWLSLYASETALGEGFLFLYQRVGRRAQETVNKMLWGISDGTVKVGRRVLTREQ
jgi:hypothetical protein